MTDIQGKSAGVLFGQAPRRHVAVVELKFQAVTGRKAEDTAKAQAKAEFDEFDKKNEKMPNVCTHRFRKFCDLEQFSIGRMQGLQWSLEASFFWLTTEGFRW